MGVIADIGIAGIFICRFKIRDVPLNPVFRSLRRRIVRGG